MEIRRWLPSGWVMISVDFPGTWLGNRAVTSRLVPFSISVSPGVTAITYSAVGSVAGFSREPLTCATGGGGTCAQRSMEEMKQIMVSAWTT